MARVWDTLGLDRQGIGQWKLILIGGGSLILLCRKGDNHSRSRYVFSLSQDSCADPPTPHISLHCPPNPHHRYAVACTAVDCIPDVSDSSWRTITIQYEANTRTITTWLTIDDDITKSSKNHIMDKVLLWQATLPSSVQPASNGIAYRLGLTAATGGFAQAVSGHSKLDFPSIDQEL